jgi:hypothetical protein
MKAGKAGVGERAPRLDVNTNGDIGSCSRASLRRARISSPRIGWVLVALRTARVADSKLIWSQRRLTS